jgi:hypothetical protein
MDLLWGGDLKLSGEPPDALQLLCVSGLVRPLGQIPCGCIEVNLHSYPFSPKENGVERNLPLHSNRKFALGVLLVPDWLRERSISSDVPHFQAHPFPSGALRIPGVVVQIELV